MRILHLDAGREMRGGQWQVVRLIRGLTAEGVESTLLAPRDTPLYLAARQEGWRVEAFGPARASRSRGAMIWCTPTTRAATPWPRSCTPRPWSRDG